ncbi:MAG: hypothetical protein AB2556_25370 [Candidatus Thiodiazotropha sp.]
MADIDDYIDQLLDEIDQDDHSLIDLDAPLLNKEQTRTNTEEPRSILNEPIPEDEERLLHWPLGPQWPLTDLDDQVPPPVGPPPADTWVEACTNAKDEFGFVVVFSTWRVEGAGGIGRPRSLTASMKEQVGWLWMPA